MILFAAIGGLFALMGFFVYYASLDNPQLEQIEIELVGVELIQVNSIENRAELETTFLVKNPSAKTFTVPLITFELFADGKSIGKGQYSTEDIAIHSGTIFGCSSRRFLRIASARNWSRRCTSVTFEARLAR